MVGSRVYVGGLPYGVRERDLEKFFKGFGRTRDILIKNGYGFVEFDDYRDADDAVYELNGKELLGERVVVEPARGVDRGGDRYRRDRYREPPPHRSRSEYGPPTRTEYRLIVENLSSRISWQDLKDYMRQAGEVTYADAHKQHRNEGGRGQSKSSTNMGVVEFATHSDMRAALDKLDGTELNGRRIRLVEDRRSSRRRSRSDSRSRSRSRRRSRSRSRSRHSSRSRSRSKSKGKKGSKSPAKSRSKTPADKENRSRSKSAGRRSRSKSSGERSAGKPASRSASRERSRSRSKDEAKPEARKSRSRSGSRSGSHSPQRNGERGSSDRSPRSGD